MKVIFKKHSPLLLGTLAAFTSEAKTTKTSPIETHIKNEDSI